ncbi:3',5'-cyclic-AMP phosphodiesterase [Endozoicomonas lisbonensis]|uniref:Icc protein n=1 Tax=Endozoicomonas lisbonensis TaxID=3120522 RepID=A0ABV2SKB8_9GAMM
MSKIRVVQISDCHVFGNTEGRLMGVDTRASLRGILDDIEQRLNSIDLIVVTGDLSQDDSKASYQWIQQQLDTLEIPYYWLAGNHDITALMQEVSPTAMQKSIIRGNWQLLLLDSHLDDGIPGLLSDSELGYMEQQLSRYSDHHTLIAFHHPAYTINSPWLDKINLQNSEAFWERINPHPNVKVVINGHIHQVQEWQQGPVQVLSAPSTAVQFKPESHDFCLDSQAPGYRVIDLLPDGTLNSQVIRLPECTQSPDLTSSGY